VSDSKKIVSFERTNDSIDPAEMAWAFPKVEPGMEPFGGRVIVQLRRIKLKTSKGGIVLVEETKESEKWNNMIGKVVAIGPLAFKNRDTMQPWPEGTWAQVAALLRVVWVPRVLIAPLRLVLLLLIALLPLLWAVRAVLLAGHSRDRVLMDPTLIGGRVDHVEWDSHGRLVRGRVHLLKAKVSADFLASVKAGVLTKNSIGFMYEHTSQTAGKGQSVSLNTRYYSLVIGYSI
jgi:hypothetical protein